MSGRIWFRCLSTAALIALWPSALIACEPVVPFVLVVGGPALLTRSLIALPIAIGLKSLVFAVLQKSLRYWLAFLLMIAGNLLTTVIGVIVAIMIGSGAAWLVGIPIVWLLCWLPAKRAVAIASRSWIQHLPAAFLAVLMTAALVVSCILFMAGQAVLVGNAVVVYWVIKLIAIYLALLVSILLSAFWEEWVVWRLARVPQNQNFAVPVLRANVYVLLVMALFAAAVVLPKRLKSPDFLVKSLRHMVAVTSR